METPMVPQKTIRFPSAPFLAPHFQTVRVNNHDKQMCGNLWLLFTYDTVPLEGPSRIWIRFLPASPATQERSSENADFIQQWQGLLGVSQNRAPKKWLVYHITIHGLSMDDLGPSPILRSHLIEHGIASANCIGYPVGTCHAAGGSSAQDHRGNHQQQ